MSDFFKLKSWLDLIQEDNFWPKVFALGLAISILLGMLYFDRYKRWAADRRERLKAAQWRRP
jgi:hypothetical protein